MTLFGHPLLFDLQTRKGLCLGGLRCNLAFRFV